MKTLLILLSLILTSCSFSAIDKSSIQNSGLSTSEQLKTESRIPIDTNWDQYANLNIGFTMKIPTEVEVSSTALYVDITALNSGSWRIQSSPATREELPELVKQLFGKDCYLKKISSWYEDIQQLVVTLPDSFAFGEGECRPRGSAWHIYYSERRNKIIYWDGGQEDLFLGSGAIMNSSFRFFP